MRKILLAIAISVITFAAVRTANAIQIIPPDNMTIARAVRDLENEVDRLERRVRRLEAIR